MGPADLKHKILAVAEEEGVAQASYALKLLQSNGSLRIAAAGKNQGTGRQQMESYHVEGPVMMFLTTTSDHPDEELQNRCLTLHVNESPQQTEAIHARQRAAYTLDGHAVDTEREKITKLHQNAQRLLEPIAVVIPWAEQLTIGYAHSAPQRPTTATPESTLTNPIFCLDAPDHLSPQQRLAGLRGKAWPQLGHPIA